MRRPPAIHHCTSQPLRFFGRDTELALLDDALRGGDTSLVAFVGPGGQGKTAIVQQWLARLQVQSSNRAVQSEVRNLKSPIDCDGVFLWSFYRGKDSDLCLREMLAYAERLDTPPQVSASWCVDRLLRVLRSERWALVLDGTEVVQHEQGGWFGRFVHPELGRLIEELASSAVPGVVVLTSRFSIAGLEHRKHARLVSLATLDVASGAALLDAFGVRGDPETLKEAASSCGLHAKAVELLGTYLAHYREGRAEAHRELPAMTMDGASAEENHVARVLAALHEAMPAELKDILALATSFRQPPTEVRLCEYLHSDPVRQLLHEGWSRAYEPFQSRSLGWLREQVQTLVDLRLLERVGNFSPLPVGEGGLHFPPLPLGEGPGVRAEPSPTWISSRALQPSPLTPVPEGEGDRTVLDAHPLVRRGFEDLLGVGHAAQTRAGFLRGRPNRRPPQSLEEAREEIELFLAYADAGLWNEADSTLVALDNPKHRFLAPAFERDLLLRFFPGGDWRQPPLWMGFGRYRSLAICLEMLGEFKDALDVYRPGDAALRGDALIALGRLQPFVNQPRMPHPWQTLWQAYRAHALALLGQREEALRLALSIVPTDIYEWVHVFECLLRLGRLDALDLGSLLYRPPFVEDHHFAVLARERMRLDFQRLHGAGYDDLGPAYRALLDAYDQGGLPFERVLTRLGYARWLETRDGPEAHAILDGAAHLCRRFGMAGLAADCETPMRGRP